MWAGAAMAAVILMRHPGVYAPALAWEGRPAAPGDEDEQQPETDRAPRRQWLPYAVASVAAARVVLLLTLHA